MTIDQVTTWLMILRSKVGCSSCRESRGQGIPTSLRHWMCQERFREGLYPVDRGCKDEIRTMPSIAVQEGQWQGETVYKLHDLLLKTWHPSIGTSRRTPMSWSKCIQGWHMGRPMTLHLRSFWVKPGKRRKPERRSSKEILLAANDGRSWLMISWW